MRKFIDIKRKVSLYSNQITISDVIDYILKAYSTSRSLKKKKKKGKERGGKEEKKKKEMERVCAEGKGKGRMRWFSLQSSSDLLRLERHKGLSARSPVARFDEVIYSA